MAKALRVREARFREGLAKIDMRDECTSREQANDREALAMIVSQVSKHDQKHRAKALAEAQWQGKLRSTQPQAPLGGLFAQAQTEIL